MMLKIVELLKKYQKPVGVSLLPLSFVVYVVMTKYSANLAENNSEDTHTQNPNLSSSFLLGPQVEVNVKLLDLSFH